MLVWHKNNFKALRLLKYVMEKMPFVLHFSFLLFSKPIIGFYVNSFDFCDQYMNA